MSAHGDKGHTKLDVSAGRVTEGTSGLERSVRNSGLVFLKGEVSARSKGAQERGKTVGSRGQEAGASSDAVSHVKLWDELALRWRCQAREDSGWGHRGQGQCSACPVGVRSRSVALCP